MELFTITPYVRFARVQRKNISCRYIVGLDNRIFYCDCGEGEITVNGRSYSMRPGAFLMIKAGVAYKNSSKTEGMTLLAFNFDFFWKKENQGNPISYVSSGEYTENMLVEPDIYKESDGIPDVLYISSFYKKDILEKTISEYNRKEKYYAERCSALIKDVIICAFRLKENTTNKRNKAEEIFSYIREHFAEALTNATVAEHFSYNKNYINQILKQHTGKTLHKFLLEYRIETAISLLQSGEYSVLEVANLVGFSEHSHFTKCCKSISGLPPSAYIPKMHGVEVKNLSDF